MYQRFKKDHGYELLRRIVRYSNSNLKLYAWYLTKALLARALLVREAERQQLLNLKDKSEDYLQLEKSV